MEGLERHHQSLALPSLMLVEVVAAETRYQTQGLVGLVERAAVVREDRLLLLQQRERLVQQTLEAAAGAELLVLRAQAALASLYSATLCLRSRPF